MTVDIRGGEQVVCIEMGNSRPGEKVGADDGVFLIPNTRRTYGLTIHTLASELPTPLVSERVLEVEGTVTRCGLKELRRMMLKYLEVD